MLRDLDIIEVMATDSQGSSSKKLKQNQDDMAVGLVVPASVTDLGLTNDLKSNGTESHNSDDLDDYNSDSSYYDESFAYDDDDSSFQNETLSLQAQFDAVDLPPGVEAPIPWLEHSPQIQNPTGASSSTVSTQLSSHNKTEKKDEAEVQLQQPDISQKKPADADVSNSSALSQPSFCTEEGKEEVELDAMSSSTIPNLSSSSRENEEKDEDEVLKKLKLFKQFDTVQDYSDHHFTLGDSKSKQAPQNWTKTIQQEWKILEKDLPDTIFVRVYEERMDLLRAVIVGAAGTPYHDGLFFFDIFFPSDYPNVPPQVFYYSGGLRLNPNLYNCGKVCLSLLNTWHGKKNEQWIPGKSTVLQVLLSIQGLVLNEKPFFNEPGYEGMAGQKEGEMRAQEYSEDAFILSCKTMLYMLRRPPKHFEDFVAGHFRECANSIMMACKAYMEGAQVGCPIGGGVMQDEDKGGVKRGSQKLQQEVSKILPRLVDAFIKNGAKDCEQFLTPKD